MSFEGYYRFLCERGHLSEYDVYSAEIGKCEEWDAGGCVMNWSKIKCSCGKRMIWRDLIDTTNREQDIQLGEKKLETLKLADISNCEHCGKSHVCTPTVYKIPETFGHKIEG